MVEGVEIDFLPVGDGEHSGDAIAIRWREDGVDRVMVYDGGTKDYGKPLVDHVKNHYGADHVDYVVNSHPDNDHAGGLLYIVENISVGEVWMHRPWEYSADICHYFHDGRITDNSLAERLKEKLSAAFELEQAAHNRGITIREPFAGCRIGIFTVLSPTKERYVDELIPQFEKAPALKKAAAVIESLFDKAVDAIGRLADAWDKEFLPETVTTTAENESSAVLFAKVGERGMLLTGDAGIETLRAAAEYASTVGINLSAETTFVQIPHHGGRHNVSSETLNLIAGTPLPIQPDAPGRTAFVSAAAKAPKHPKRVVTNAFIRRGFRVVQTKGDAICHYFGLPARANWGPAKVVPFYSELDD